MTILPSAILDRLKLSKIYVLVTFLLAASFAQSAVPAPPDPCDALFQKLRKFNDLVVVARPSDVLLCTQSVAFKSSRDLGTLDSVVNFLRSFYSLLHVAQSSPEPRLPSSYDVVGALREIGKKRWTRAEDFYDAVTAAVGKLNDAHTKFEPGCPPFVHTLALPLVSVVEVGANVIRVAPRTMIPLNLAQMAFQPPFGFDTQSYTGALVDKIEGVPAWQYLQNWVNSNPSSYHDVGQKVNHALTNFMAYNGTKYLSFGAFGDRTINPRNDTLRVTLRLNTTTVDISVPWISYTNAINAGSFTSARAYYAAFCAPRLATPPLVALAQGIPDATSPNDSWGRGPVTVVTLLEGKEVAKEVYLKDGDMPPAVVRGAVPLSAQQRSLSKMRGQVFGVAYNAGVLISGPADYFPVYLLSDGKTAVVCLHTFYPMTGGNTQNEYVESILFFINELGKSLRLAGGKAKQVIIDVSGNMGGYGSLINFSVELLMGTSSMDSIKAGILNTPFQYLAETEVPKLLQRENFWVYNFTLWRDLDGKKFRSKSRFFNPLMTMSFGKNGQAGTYSSFFKESFVKLSQILAQDFQPAVRDKPLAVFSNGLCFSACMAFATALKVGYNVKLVTAGGVRGVKMAFGGGGGGFVSAASYEDFIATFSRKMKELPEAPKQFGVRANLGSTISNGFLYDKSTGNPRTDVPLEFVFVPGDVQVDYSIENVGNPAQLYLDVARTAFRK